MDKRLISEAIVVLVIAAVGFFGASRVPDQGIRWVAYLVVAGIVVVWAANRLFALA